ncbi:MAG: polysaccharide pyruvyl transferase family protein [Elusimicrobiota bacterium]|jgi:hypothetical protein|nr:polysaccharide pyruvyl transferase family protein [Elusimicrobiota bacterium]
MVKNILENNIVLYNPAISSMNIGDKIIAEAAKKKIEELFKGNFVLEVSTFFPVSYYHMRHFKDAKYKFVLGSNLLKSTFFGLKKQWDIKLRQSSFVGPVILMGAGWWQYNNKPNLYTKLLYKKLLYKDYIHSVRDDFTLKKMKSMGIKNVINTSCPTMWNFTEEFNSKIPTRRAENVIFTVNAGNKDELNDAKMIDLLHKEYYKVFFWPQEIKDKQYVDYLERHNSNKSIVINPNLKDYDNFLENNDTDYIGTRLHGGIRALQKYCRSLILTIDNRANEKKKDFNLPVIKRGCLSEIKKFIKKDYAINILIPEKEIFTWKSQFRLS